MTSRRDAYEVELRVDTTGIDWREVHSLGLLRRIDLDPPRATVGDGRPAPEAALVFGPFDPSLDEPVEADVCRAVERRGALVLASRVLAPYARWLEGG